MKKIIQGAFNARKTNHYEVKVINPKNAEEYNISHHNSSFNPLAFIAMVKDLTNYPFELTVLPENTSQNHESYDIICGVHFYEEIEIIHHENNCKWIEKQIKEL